MGRTVILHAVIVAVLADSLTPLMAAQTVGPSAKPPHRQVQTTCARCVDQAKAVNQAYDSLNFLWDRKLSIQKSIAMTQKAIADRRAEIAKLEAATPTSGRSLQQQQSIDALKQINAQQTEGVERQQRNLAEIDRRIEEQNAVITDRLAALERCEKVCATPPADPPLPATAGPTPGVTSTDTGDVTDIAVACPACQKLVEMILDLQEQRAEIVADLERMETEAELLFNGIAKEFGDAKRPPRPGGRTGLLASIEDGYDDLDQIEAEIKAAWAMLTICILNCNLVPKRRYTQPYFYAPVIGAGVLGGFLLKGGSTQSAPPPVGTSPQTTQPPTQQPTTQPPPTPQTSCSSINGTYSLAASIRLPRGCFIVAGAPVFNSPINVAVTMQLNDACSGTVMTRHPNSWAFAYNVSGTVSGSAVRVRSTAPFVNTQPFGVAFNSSVDLTVTGNSATGSETHMSSSCTDVYDLQGTKQ